MNHLRELIECIDSGTLTFTENMPDEDCTGAETILIESLPNAVCFFAGDYGEMPPLKAIPELQKLPYPVTWIEFDDHLEHRHQTICVLCVERNDLKGNVFHGIVRQGDRKWRYISTSLVYLTGKIGTEPRLTAFERKATLALTDLAGGFISAINCKNINRIEHNQDAKLQRARAKKGKQPLFDYWTLEVDLKKSRASGVDLGGTHASPRLHLRRGHVRQYSPGNYCWVQPCVVGDGALGVVGKDYRVTGIAE